MDMQDWVKMVGMSVLLIGIFLIIFSKFRHLDMVGAQNTSDTIVTANESIGEGISLLSDLIDYVEIGVLILIGAYFFSKLKTNNIGQ